MSYCRIKYTSKLLKSKNYEFNIYSVMHTKLKRVTLGKMSACTAF